MDAQDRAMLAFGVPMGPFALLDQIGLDTARQVGGVLRAAFGERIGSDASLLDTMVSDDRLGQKNGKGFYRYRDGKRTVPDPLVYELAGSTTTREIPAETLQERMVLAVPPAHLGRPRQICAERDVELTVIGRFTGDRRLTLRYGEQMPLAGQFAGGALNDGGEQLVLSDRYGGVIQDFTYNDKGAWPGRPDGNGSTLEVLDTGGDYNDGNNWRSNA